MGMHQAITQTTHTALRPEVVRRYEILEQCILSDQVSDAEVQAMMSEDPGFAGWLEARCRSRQGLSS